MNFDIQVPVDAGTVFTLPFDACEKHAVQFNVEERNGFGGTLTATPQHSADGGLSWIDKSALTLTGTGSFTANSVTGLFGGDDGSTPHHAMMRFKITSTRIANVRVFVWGRGRARPVTAIAYEGAVPVGAVASLPFDIDSGAQRGALQAIVIPIGASTTPAITVRLQVSGDYVNYADQQVTAEIAGVTVTGRQLNSVGGSFDLRNAKSRIGRFLLLSGSGSLDNTNYVRLYTTTWVKSSMSAGPESRDSADQQRRRTMPGLFARFLTESQGSAFARGFASGDPELGDI